MQSEIKEKFQDFIILILWVIFDALIVLFVSAVAVFVKYALEDWIFHSKLEAINNFAVLTIYETSKVFLIAIFLIYVAFDIILLIINFVKRLKK